MFGAWRIAKARTACVNALQPFVARPLNQWPPEFWRDPFVVGFLLKVIALMGNLATGDKLTRERQAQVFNGTLTDVGADASAFLDRVLELNRARDPDFMLGARNAETVVTYVMNLHPMPNDPDVATATEVAKGTTLTGKVGREEIGGSLMYMLFTQVVKRRLGV